MTKPKPTPVPVKAKRVRAATPELPKDVADDLAAFKITPLRWMLSVVNDTSADPARRDRMAASAAQYLHRRMQDGGIKEAREAEAKKVAKTGRFKTGAAPKHLQSRDD